MIYIGFNYESEEIQWKKIYWLNGEETKYYISNIGIVINDKNGKLLKTNFSKGYERLNLTHKGEQKQFFVHRLVAEAFVPNPYHKLEVNHINGIKSCNYDYNLEWVTRQENQIHAIKTGLAHPGYDYSNLSIKQVKKICKLLEENELSQKQIADKVGCSRVTVGAILQRKTHTDISCMYNIDNYVIKTDFSKKGDESEITKYPDKDIIKVCELIDSGHYKLPEIAEMTNIPYQTVRNVYYGSCRKDISKNYNFGKLDTNPLYEQKKLQAIKVCELLNSGLNTKEVSEELGVPRTYVRNICAGSTWKDVSMNYDFMKKKKNK